MTDWFQCSVLFNGDVCHKMKLFVNSTDMQKKTPLQRINSTTTSRHPTVNNLSQIYLPQTVHPPRLGRETQTIKLCAHN